MPLYRTPSTPLAREFTFAGFAWPRYVATLPEGPLRIRCERRKHRPCTGGYFHAPRPDANGRGFYLGDAGQPCARWAWADAVEGTPIAHRGWYSDDENRETIRGLVLRLPHGRFLAGWSMGERMASEVDAKVYDNEQDAARVADESARIAAEHEREYQARENARIAEEEREITIGADD